MWLDTENRKTPPIDYFEPGNLYNHPAVINNLKRLGGRPGSIHIEEVNRQPDDTVVTYLKRQINM